MFEPKRGLNADVVREISFIKGEPEWMTKFRLRVARDLRAQAPARPGAGTSSGIDFQNIFYFIRSSEKQSTDWNDVPADIKNTFDRLGIPEAEQKYLSGVSAQYESEVVYHSLRAGPRARRASSSATRDTALREHEDLFREHWATVIPPGDNKLAALNSAVWSGGSFIWVPPGVEVEIPLQAYFRINAENMGQFERTLIICEPDSFVHYVEGCTAPGLHQRLAPLGGGRDHRQGGRALPLHDHPELVHQRLQPGHQAGRGARERHDGVGRRQPRLAS